MIIALKWYNRSDTHLPRSLDPLQPPATHLWGIFEHFFGARSAGKQLQNSVWKLWAFRNLRHSTYQPLKRGREASLLRIAILHPVIEKGGIDQIKKCLQGNTQQIYFFLWGYAHFNAGSNPSYFNLDVAKNFLGISPCVCKTIPQSLNLIPRDVKKHSILEIFFQFWKL